MAEPARKLPSDIEPDIRPSFGVIQGGGETTPDRAHLRALDNQESHPDSVGGGSISEREANGSNVIQGPWANKTTAGGNSENANRFVTGLRKKSPLIAILLTIVGGGGALLTISGPALLPIYILENLVLKYDSQNTSLTIRTNKIIADKIAGDNTSGSCSVVKIACRFSRPSNKLLRNLADNGITALDSKGATIDAKGLFPNTIPKNYEFIDSSGNKLTVAAGDFAKTLANNSEFRAAFHNAYNPRFIGYADAVFKSIEERFGFNKKDSAADFKDSADATNKINEDVVGEDPNSAAGKAAAAEGGAVADNEAKALIGDTAKKEVSQIAESGKGNAVGLIAGAVCAAGDIPGLFIKTEQAYQMAQLIRYSMIFLTAFSAIKASNANQTETSVLLGLLTAVVAGKTAMNSFGMKFSLLNDTGSPTKSSQKFVPGGSAIANLGGVASITNSGIKTQVCTLATNPATGAAIDAATSETIIGPLINLGIGLGASLAIDQLAPTIIDGILNLVPPGTFEQALGFMFGDLTTNLQGEDVGDALASGASNMMGQTANAGGNVPLTVDQAVAYNSTTQQVNIAYAEEDRATLSPLDPSNPNTIVGSIVSQLMPYYSDFGSVTGAMSSIGSIVSSSIGSLFGSTANAAGQTQAEQYQLCTDPALSGVAAGPFCNIAYGIPPEYLDIDPQTVISDLTASGDIDANTGEPVDKNNPVISTISSTSTSTGSLKGWLDLCTDGTTSQAVNCEITDRTTAEYALYTIDHRIQQTMDGEDTTLDPTQTTDTSADTGSFSQLIGLLNSFSSPSLDQSIQDIATNSTQKSSSTIKSNQTTNSLSYVVESSNKFLAIALPSRKHEGIVV